MVSVKLIFHPHKKGGGISGAGDMLGGSVPSPETKKATPESGLLEDSLTDDDDGARRDDESKSEV